jgi:hypothetical protein
MTRGIALFAVLSGILGISGVAAGAQTDQPAIQPAILDVTITPVPVRVGAPVTAIVLTTPDVVSVQGHVAAFNFNVPKTADGNFSGTATVPRWARFFIHGDVHVRFVARTADGTQTQMISVVPV